MIAVLRQRNFALLWIGGLVSLAGDWVLLIGLPIYVYLLTRSVAATSITLIAGIVPMIVLSPVAGVFVDRWNRQRTLVIVNVLLAVGLLPLLFVRGADDVWIVYVVNFVETCLEQFLVPTQAALVPAVVGEAHLVPANSLIALGGNLARLGGPPLGGVVAASFGITGMAAADATSYLVAALCLASMRLAASPTTGSAAGVVGATAARAGSWLGAVARIWRELAEGLRLLTSQRVLVVLVVVLAFAAQGEGFFAPLFPVFVYQELHGGPLQIGELMSAQAVGALFASLLVGWLGKRAMSRWVAGLGWLGFGLIMVAICFAPVLLPPIWRSLTGAELPIPLFWVELGLFAAVGVPGLVGSTGTVSLLQMRSPDAYRGRIFGAEGAIAGLMILAGAVAAGTLPERFGLLPIFSGQGVAKIIAGLLMMALLPVVSHAVADRVNQPVGVGARREEADLAPSLSPVGGEE